jgi:hypothetical protein
MSAVDGGPELENHHHHHTGHRWLDVTLAVSAIMISMISLFLAIQHGRAMERMVEATTWPYVMVDSSTANLDGTPHITLRISNKGVGPARIASVEVFFQDAALTDPEMLLRTVLQSPDPTRRWPLLQSDVIDSVLSAKEAVNLVDLDARNFTSEEYARIGGALEKMTFRTCYCSVFDECWMLDTRKAARAAAVKACPVPRVQFQH